MTITQEEKDAFHKAMDEERSEQDARLEKLIEADRPNIPSNDEILQMIPSKAVRDYLQKNGHQFSERDRYLLSLYLDSRKKEESEELWEKGRYVSVPHPFRRGDIVACYNYCPVFQNSGEHTGGFDIGIMRSFSNDEDWENWDKDVKTRLKSLTDFSDVSTTVEFLNLDGSFSHQHPNPMELEFARDVEGALPEDTKKTEFLEVASELLKGEGSIESFEMYRKSYLESAGHMKELLTSILQELREYMQENFNSYGELYISNDLKPLQKLTKEQKNKACNFLWRMQCNVRTIEDNVKDLMVPVKALKKAGKTGALYKNAAQIANERNYLNETSSILSEIFEEYKIAQTRIKLFTEMQKAPRKQFYQTRIESAISKLKKELEGLVEIGE